MVTQQIVLVRMAEMAVFGTGEKAKTTLGSCVGVILHDKQRKQSALAHIMLPSRYDGDQTIAKYADTAIPALVQELGRRGSKKEDLEAYLTGGAQMFGSSDDRLIASVGEANLRAARTILQGLEIDVVFEHTGGNRGRTVLFDSDSASIEVKTIQTTFGPRSEE